MSEAKYNKLIGDAEAPPPLPTLPEYAETDPIYTPGTGENGPAKTHVFKSLLASCIFPTGLVGLFYSMKTHRANKAGHYRDALKHSAWARKSFLVTMALAMLALVGTTAFYVGFVVREVCAVNHAFKDGMNTGMASGAAAGEIYAKDLLSKNGNARAKLPSPVPMANRVNPFDIRKDNPFWVEVMDAVKARRRADAAKPFGEHFGWAHGFKVGFCAVEGTDCEGVVFVNSSCPYKAVFGGLGPWRRNHGRHGEEEGEKENE